MRTGTRVAGWILAFWMVTVLGGCRSADLESDRLLVGVSIVPQQALVEAVAGSRADVVVMIPPGASPANYAPSPAEMRALAEAPLYFLMGVPAEETGIVSRIPEFSPGIRMVDLAGAVDRVHPPRTMGGNAGVRDPHIWMSPRRARVMTEVIRDELSRTDPENAGEYRRNAAALLRRLEEIDGEIRALTADLESRSFLILHPSLGYFAMDYGLEMVAIERDGKEASPAHLQEIIEWALENQVRAVFYQEEFDAAQARVVAREIGGETQRIAPLSPEYPENIRAVAEMFREVHE